MTAIVTGFPKVWLAIATNLCCGAVGTTAVARAGDTQRIAYACALAIIGARRAIGAMTAIVATLGAGGNAVATAGHRAIGIAAISTAYRAKFIANSHTLGVGNTARGIRTMLTVVASLFVRSDRIATRGDRAIVVATIAIDLIAVVACFIKVDNQVAADILGLAVGGAIAIIPWRAEAIANSGARSAVLA